MEVNAAMGAGEYRPTDPSRSEVVIIADGWRKSTFIDLLERGELPEIQEHYLQPDTGALLENVISNVPSVSIASHASILTGSFQDEHHIPGHRWQAADCSCCRNYLSLRGPFDVNRDLSSEVTTFLEDAPAGMARIAVQSVVRRGAEIQSSFLSQHPERILNKLGQLIIDNPHSRSVAWLPRVDSLSHLEGPDSPRVYEEMKRTAQALGKLACTLKNAGIWDNASILIAPDHGHRPIQYHTSLKQVMKRTNIASSVNSRYIDQNRVNIRTSGDGSAYVYLPKSESLHSLEITEFLASNPEISLACYREGTDTHVLSDDGYGLLHDNGEDGLTYEVRSGSDPLALTSAEAPTLAIPSVPLMGKYPDFLHQYSRSYVEGRSADILLFADNDTHFGSVPRLGWRFGYHRGTHGGPSVDEVVVSAIYKGQVSNIDRVKAIRSADLLQELGLKSLSISGVSDNDLHRSSQLSALVDHRGRRNN